MARKGDKAYIHWLKVSVYLEHLDWYTMMELPFAKKTQISIYLDIFFTHVMEERDGDM